MAEPALVLVSLVALLVPPPSVEKVLRRLKPSGQLVKKDSKVAPVVAAGACRAILLSSSKVPGDSLEGWLPDDLLAEFQVTTVDVELDEDHPVVWERELALAERRGAAGVNGASPPSGRSSASWDPWSSAKDAGGEKNGAQATPDPWSSAADPWAAAAAKKPSTSTEGSKPKPADPWSMWTPSKTDVSTAASSRTPSKASAKRASKESAAPGSKGRVAAAAAQDALRRDRAEAQLAAKHARAAVNRAAAKAAVQFASRQKRQKAEARLKELGHASAEAAQAVRQAAGQHACKANSSTAGRLATCIRRMEVMQQLRRIAEQSLAR